ncbi:TIR domain-containing protein [Micromonospora sp. BQ11]|uniref:TIR domain-containing protein n=1 Tax=Micromonospora sp. BQ11 TaxID=3452212 RepID=UPI003F89A01B
MFIHFLNDQILALHRLPQRFEHRELVRHLYRMLWAGSLVSDTPLIIPAVDLVQSPVGIDLIEPLASISAHGLVEYVGSTGSVDELVQRKLIHFRGTGLHPEWQESKVHEILQPIAPHIHSRSHNTTLDMLANWTEDVDRLTGPPHREDPRRHEFRYGERQLGQGMRFLDERYRFPKLIDRAALLPARLGDHAFLWNVVQRVNAMRVRTDGPATEAFERALAHYWVLSHVDEYRVSIIGRDRTLGRIACGLHHSHPDLVLDLGALHRFLGWMGIDFLLQPGDPEELIELKEFPYLSGAFSGVLMPKFAEFEHSPERRADKMRDIGQIAARTINIRRSVTTIRKARLEALRVVADLGFGGQVLTRTPPSGSSSLQTTAGMDERVGMTLAAPTIFIGHGRSLLWLQLRDFIRDRLQLGWEEFNRVPVAGLTVVDRLSHMLHQCDFAFLVLTGEDEQRDGTLRARQNVVHELGLFQGRLGFDRAIILLEEGCEDFSNVAGLQQLTFPVGKIMAVAEEIRLLLEDRLMIGRTP